MRTNRKGSVAKLSPVTRVVRHGSTLRLPVQGQVPMKTLLGPIPRNKIILCTADASPSSQRTSPDKAGVFFPRAPWVGAVRNCAERLNSKFVILTTGHGMVEPDEVISPYDFHIHNYRSRVAERWRSTIPTRLSKNRGSLIVFYAGGCPRDDYIELCRPILCELGISLLTFGKPNMFDVDKIEKCVQMLASGTSLAEIASILRSPDRLEFYFHLDRLCCG